MPSQSSCTEAAPASCLAIPAAPQPWHAGMIQASNGRLPPRLSPLRTSAVRVARGSEAALPGGRAACDFAAGLMSVATLLARQGSRVPFDVVGPANIVRCGCEPPEEAGGTAFLSSAGAEASALHSWCLQEPRDDHRCVPQATAGRRPAAGACPRAAGAAAAGERVPPVQMPRGWPWMPARELGAHGIVAPTPAGVQAGRCSVPGAASGSRARLPHPVPARPPCRRAGWTGGPACSRWCPAPPTRHGTSACRSERCT